MPLNIQGPNKIQIASNSSCPKSNYARSLRKEEKKIEVEQNEISKQALSVFWQKKLRPSGCFQVMSEFNGR